MELAIARRHRRLIRRRSTSVRTERTDDVPPAAVHRTGCVCARRTRRGGSPGAVLTPAEQARYEEGFGLPAGAFDGFGDTSRAGAAPAPGRHSVILLSHGGGLCTAFHVAQATELASRGFVVIGIDHPGDAELVDDRPAPATRFGTTSHQGFTDIVWLVPQLGRTRRTSSSARSTRGRP